MVVTDFAIWVLQDKRKTTSHHADNDASAIAHGNISSSAELPQWTTPPPNDSGADVSPGQQRLAEEIPHRLLEATRVRNIEVTI